MAPFCHDIRDPLKDFHESSLSLNLIVDCSRVIELLDNTVEIYGDDPGIWEDEEQECNCIQAIKDLTYLAGQGSTCAHDAVYRACEHYFAVVRTVAVKAISLNVCVGHEQAVATAMAHLHRMARPRSGAAPDMGLKHSTWPRPRRAAPDLGLKHWTIGNDWPSSTQTHDAQSLHRSALAPSHRREGSNNNRAPCAPSHLQSVPRSMRTPPRLKWKRRHGMLATHMRQPLGE